MRKTFLTICAAAFALLAVSSCGKQFDEINDRIDSIENRIDSLETALNEDVADLAALDATHKALDEAVKALEAALKEQIANGDKANADASDANAAEIKNLQADVAALQAQLAGVKVEVKDGALVVTIGDNSFTLSKNGVLTIVEVDGVKYWGLVDHATGEVTNLNVKVGHDLKFKVDPETAEVLICYDGDEYVGTGVYAAKDATTLIGDVEETDEYVKITIGDATYVLEKWADDKSVLGLSRTDFFLMYGAEKVVELTAEDIEEYYVMAKPDGWKASLEGKTLTVVAPAKKAYEVGAAEAEGEVLIHATTVEGKCKVAKIDVKTGDGLTLEVDREGNVFIQNAYVGMSGNEEIGYTYGFQNFKIGIVPSAEFYSLGDMYGDMFGSTDPYVVFESAFEMTYGEPMAGMYCYYYNNTASGKYVEAEYEVDVIERNILEICSEDMFIPELPYGPYVVWVASLNDDGTGIVGGVRYAEFNYVKVEIELVEALYNDLKVKVAVEGADEYMIGYIAESSFKSNGGGIGPLAASTDDFADFDAYMLGNRGPWPMFKENGVAYYLAPQFGQQMPADYIAQYFPEEGALLSSFDMYGEKLSFNERYYFWVMPMYSHMAKFDDVMWSYDYSAYDYDEHFKPYLVSFTTKDIQDNGSVTPTITFTEESWTTLSVEVQAEGADMVYYALFGDDAFTDFSSDPELVDAVIAGCQWPETGSFAYTFDRDVDYVELESDAKYHLAVVAIDAAGKYKLATKSAETKGVPTKVNDNYTVTFGTETREYESVAVNVTPSAVGTTYYKFYTKDSYDMMDTADVLMEVLVENEILDEQRDVIKQYSNPDTKYVLAVVVVGEDATDYKLLTKDCATKSLPYSDNVKLSLKSLEYFGVNSYGATFDVEGATDIIYQVASSGMSSALPMNVIKYAPTKDANYGTYNYAAVVNGVVTIYFESSTSFFDYSSDLYVVAYNVTDGEVTSMSEVLAFEVAEKYAELNPVQ